MACWTLFVLAVAAFAHVSDAIIGKNSITCITFDAPQYNWFGDPIGSNGVWLNNFGVEVTPGVGSSGFGVENTHGGEFKDHSMLQIPYLQGNDFSEFAVSIWFKRKTGGVGPSPMIASNGDCINPTIEIVSMDMTSIRVKLSSTYETVVKTVTTPAQDSKFIHVVVTARMSRVNGWGWVKIYIDGKKEDSGFLNGRLPGTFYPMTIGASMCPMTTYFEGVMDTISFARWYLKPLEVKALYDNPKACIGE